MLRKVNVTSILLIFLMLSVPTATGQVVDETTNIGTLDVGGYFFTVSEDDASLIIDIEIVSGNDISFYITDQENGQKALSNQQFQAYGSRINIVSGSFEVEIGNAGIYYVILDNTDSFTSTTVDITVSIEYPSSNFFLGLIVIFGVIGGIYYLSQRNSNDKSHKNTINQATTSNESQSIYCGNCGTENQGNKFCQKCGQKL